MNGQKIWHVDFNPKKTKVLVITNVTPPEINIEFSGENVEIINYHKHVSVTLSSDVNWTTHIDNITTSSLKQVYVLRKLKFTLSKKSVSNIYISFIRPLLEYACDMWDGCFEYDTEKIEKIQLKAARIVTGLTKFSSLEVLYFEIGWEILAERRRQRKLTTFYKMHNKSCLQYLSECLPPLHLTSVDTTFDIMKMMYSPDVDYE